MKNIKDLKEDILNKSAGHIFVFNGEEWAIKKHYIEKIAEDYKVVRYLTDTLELSNTLVSRSLLKRKTLYVVPHDNDFLKASKKEIENVLSRVKNSTDGVIWVFSTEIPKSFITHFDEYITEFEEVEEDIFEQLIRHEVSISPDHIKLLSKNCRRNYGTALMEIDKIKNYAQHENVSFDTAFEDLYINKLLIEEKEIFNCQEFMNNVLAKNFTGLRHSLQCLYESGFENVWYHLEEMVQDFKILYCFVRYGKWEGAKRAYNVEGLFWGRVKEIRDTVLHWSDDRQGKCLDPWTEDEIQWIICKLSESDTLVKQGKITDREVIENMFYYYL